MYKSCEQYCIIDDTYKSYTILSEIYKTPWEDVTGTDKPLKPYLWGYIVMNHRGKVFEVSARELAKWN